MAGGKEGAVDPRIGEIGPFWTSQIAGPLVGSGRLGAIGADHQIGGEIQGTTRRTFVEKPIGMIRFEQRHTHVGGKELPACFPLAIVGGRLDGELERTLGQDDAGGIGITWMELPFGMNHIGDAAESAPSATSGLVAQPVVARLINQARKTSRRFLIVIRPTRRLDLIAALTLIHYIINQCEQRGKGRRSKPFAGQVKIDMITTRRIGGGCAT